MSLFTSFNAGVAGIKTAQSGLNTTAHNLANTKTAGYSRQQNIQSDSYYQVYKSTDKSVMQIGYGTQVDELRQIRDQFLDREYRNEAGRCGFYEVLYTTEQEVEDILGEMEGVEFDDALEAMWENIQELADNPEAITKRELFITQADAFLEKATNVYQALRNYQINLNTQIQEKVNAINKIADEIAELNFKIARVEALGVENANDFRDRRNLLLDQLSEYTYFDYYEVNTGMVTVRINNVPLVEDRSVYHLACEKYDADELTSTGPARIQTEFYNVVWADGGFGDVYTIDKAYSREDDSDMGSLLGTLTARGRKYGYYTDIPMREDYETDYEYSLVTKDYNNSTGNCLLEKMEAQFDLLIHKVVTAINDALAPNVEVSVKNNGGTFSSNLYLTQSGGTEQTSLSDINGNSIFDLSSLADGESKGLHVLNSSQCPVAADDETIGEELFVRKAQDGKRYDIYTVNGPVYVEDAEGNRIEVTQRTQDSGGNTVYKLYLYREEDEADVNSLYTLQNLAMNQKILENYSYLPVKGNPAEGAYGTYDYGEGGVFDTMLAGWRKKDTLLEPNTLSVYSAEGMYDAIVTNLGTQGSIWKSQLDNQEILVNNVEDKRQQMSGVSTDEEMVSLLMYQHAYNAASRYITVIDEMLEHIIERLG